MTYIPRRDYRFEYIWEAMQFIEDNQCASCKFSEPGEYPMCVEVSTHFMMEDPVPMVDDKGDDGLECTRFEPF